MSKKMMLLALAAVSAAMFALPAAASADELHFANVTTFTGHAPEGSLTGDGKKITCETTHVTGSFDAGSTTTGKIHLDFTGCHVTVLGFTVKCRTVGSALDNTITTEGTFHLITTENTPTIGKPAILVTPNTTELSCAGQITIVHGTVIGTITSPACGGKSKTMGLSFTATGESQNDKSYTGKTVNLTTTTNSTETPGSQAGLATTPTITSGTEGTLTCT